MHRQFSPKTKEIYFVFAIIIIFLIGFVLGSYFDSKLCSEHISFRGKYIEDCFYQRGVYENLCGDYENLIENEDLQVCINACYS